MIVLAKEKVAHPFGRNIDKLEGSFETWRIRRLRDQETARLQAARKLGNCLRRPAHMLKNMIANNQIKGIACKLHILAIDFDLRGVFGKQIAANIGVRRHSSKPPLNMRFRRQMQNASTGYFPRNGCCGHVMPHMAVPIVAAAFAAHVAGQVGSNGV